MDKGSKIILTKKIIGLLLDIILVAIIFMHFLNIVMIPSKISSLMSINFMKKIVLFISPLFPISLS